jgi:hypothetical protein
MVILAAAAAHFAHWNHPMPSAGWVAFLALSSVIGFFADGFLAGLPPGSECERHANPDVAQMVHRLTLRRFDLGFVAAKRDVPCKAWTSSVSRAGELGSARKVCAALVEVAATTGSPKVLSTIAFT